MLPSVLMDQLNHSASHPGKLYTYIRGETVLSDVSRNHIFVMEVGYTLSTIGANNKSNFCFAEDKMQKQSVRRPSN